MRKYFEYKNEIQGLNDVISTVKATEKIAASNIHLLKKETKNFELYIKSLEQAIKRLLLFYSVKNYPFLSQKIQGQKTIVIITGNKGLVGGLYHNLVNLFLKEHENYQSLINIGDKGRRYLEEENIKIYRSFSNISEIPQSQEITAITNYIFSEFQTKKVKKIDILYPRFISISQQEPTIVRFLPFEFSLNKSNHEDELSAEKNLGLPIFEPSSKKVFDRLFKKYIKIFFYKIIIEAKLSEISARTVAAEHAAAKTKESIQNLIIDYSKERRKITTQRQIESFIIHQTV